MEEGDEERWNGEMGEVMKVRRRIGWKECESEEGKEGRKNENRNAPLGKGKWKWRDSTKEEREDRTDKGEKRFVRHGTN